MNRLDGVFVGSCIGLRAALRRLGIIISEKKKIETLLNKPLAFTSGSTEKNQKAHQFASNYLLDLLDCCLKLVKRFAAFLLKNREKCLV